MELEDEEQGEEQQPRRPEPQQEPRLNGKVLYDIAGGTPHGRFAIGNGAVRAADVRAAAKENRSHPSNSVSMQSMAREMACLRRANESLQRDNRAKDIATDLILVHIFHMFIFLQLMFFLILNYIHAFTAGTRGGQNIPRTEPKLSRTGTEGNGTEKVRFPFGSMIRGTEVSQ